MLARTINVLARTIKGARPMAPHLMCTLRPTRNASWSDGAHPRWRRLPLFCMLRGVSDADGVQGRCDSRRSGGKRVECSDGGILLSAGLHLSSWRLPTGVFSGVFGPSIRRSIRGGGWSCERECKRRSHRCNGRRRARHRQRRPHRHRQYAEGRPMCRSCAGFSDACMTPPSTRADGRRPRTAKARNRG